MGTYYRVVVIDDAEHFSSEEAYAAFNETAFQKQLDLLLTKLISSMSTYEPDSEISIFNALPGHSCQEISPQFAAVMSLAMSFSEKSEGYFNPLLNPLVHRWGFAVQDSSVVFPAPDEIDKLLQLTQLDTIKFNLNSNSLCKYQAVELDLSAIAKGYSVDEIARLLIHMGVKSFLIDIGGEVRVLGQNANRKPWRLAIEKPDGSGSIHQVIQLTEYAIATSGDYRNYFIHEGQRYSHLINPKTGYPLSHSIASVSVIADTTAKADGWATALIAMGEVNARRIVEAKGLAVLMVFRENGVIDESSQVRFRTWTSQAFGSFIESNN